MFKAAGLTIILAKDMPMNPDYFGIRMYTLV